MAKEAGLIAALHELVDELAILEPAARLEANSGRAGPATDRLYVVTSSIEPLVRDAMGGDPDPPLGFWQGTMMMGLSARMISQPLLRVALAQGPEAAIGWLHRVVGIRSAPGKWVAHGGGLTLSEEAELIPGFRILPGTKASARPITHFPLPPFLGDGWTASLDVPDTPAVVPAPFDGAGTALVDARVRLERYMTALAALGGAPQIHTWSFEYDDPDLRALSREGGLFHPMVQLDLRERPVLDIGSARRLIEGYGRLGEKHRRSIDLAAERLVRSRIGLHPGDQALDGAIALEAIFGDEQGEEISYRIRLRAALFLGADVAERRTIQRTVKDFYAIRSKVAHGRVSSTAAGDKGGRETIRDGLDLAQRAAALCCERGSIPNWADVELGARQD